MAVGVLGSQRSYREHLRPVWDALEPAEQACWVESQAGGLPSATTWLSASQRDTAALRKTQARRVHMEHGVGLQWYPASQLRQLLGCSAIAAPNERIAERYRERAPRLRVEVIGTPKLDALSGIDENLKGSVKSKVAAISLHWSGVMRQNPTSFALWRPLIEELAADRELLGHAHPKIWSKAKRFYEEMGIEPVESFEEVCRRASLYLCDHGSTLYEWAALDRELIWLRRPEHQQQIPQASGLLWDSFSGIGPELKLGGSLRAALEAAADPQYREARQEATEALYPYIGSATRRAIDLLHEIEEDVHAN